MENDDVPAGVRILGLKKNGFRDSLLQLSFQCKDLEDHYEAIHQTIERRADEVRVREEALKNGLRDMERLLSLLESKRSEFDLLWEAMDARLRGVNVVESMLIRAEEIMEKTKEFETSGGEILGLINAKFKEVEGKEKELKLKEEEINMRYKKVFECAVQVKTDKEKLSESSKALFLREKRFEDMAREFELRNVEFDSEKEKLDESAGKLELRDLEITERLKEIESRNKEVEDKWKQLDCEDKRIKFENNKLELEKQKLDADRSKLDKRLLDLEEQCKLDKRLLDLEEQCKLDKRLLDLEEQCKLDKRLLDLEEQCKAFEMNKRELQLDRKILNEELREFELKNKKLDENRIEIELSKKELETQLEQVKGKKSERPSKDRQDNNDSPCIVISGSTLQIFLNDCWKDQEKIGSAVCVLLRLSPDPAKLVLDAVQTFFPPHLTKGGVEFSGGIVRRSCIFLLEQLMKMPPNFNQTVKAEARRLSFGWITKLKGDADHTSEILGFLLLLAVYDLGSTFDLNELFNYVKIVAHCRQLPHICRLLGMSDKIRGLIQELIGQKKQTVAIRYIMEFNLAKQFSLCRLLKDHMETSKIVFETAEKNGNHSLDAQMHAINKRVSDLKDFIRCIENYKIPSSCSVANLRQVIASLEKKKTELEKQPGHRVESTTLHCNHIGIAKIDSSPTTSPWKASPNCVDTFSSTRTIEMDGHHQGELSSQDPLPKKEDHSDAKAISLEISDSNSGLLKSAKNLQAIPCPARYVLGALNDFLQSKKSGEKILLLLKEFKKLPCKFDPETIADARKLSVLWKSNLTLKNRDLIKVTCFLLFLDVYELVTGLDADEVIHLFDPKQLQDYFELIGMPEFFPDLIQKLIDSNNHIKAIKYIHAFNLRGRFPIVPLLDEFLQYWKNQADEICKVANTKHHFQMNAISRRLSAMRSAIKLIRECKLEKEYNIRGLEETIAELVLQKSEKSKNQLSGQKRKASESMTSWKKRPKKLTPFKGKYRTWV